MVRRRRPTDAERVGSELAQLRSGTGHGRFETVPGPRSDGGVGGLVVAAAPSGVNVEHVTLVATAGQTVPDGGGDVEWASLVGPPAERRGFVTLTLPSVAIPMPVTGVAWVDLDLLYTGYRDGGDVTITRTRGSSVATLTLTSGPLTSRFFTASRVGVEVEAGDTLTVGLPNSSGGDVTLASGTVDVAVVELAKTTSTEPDESYVELADPNIAIPTSVSGTQIGGGNILLVGAYPYPSLAAVTENKASFPGTGSTAVSVPAGTGGYLVAFCSAQAQTSWNTPSGWTKLTEFASGTSGPDRTIALFIRVADGTEGSSVSFSTAAYANSHVITMSRVTGADSYEYASFSDASSTITSAVLSSGEGAYALWWGYRLQALQSDAATAATIDVSAVELSDQFALQNSSRGNRGVLWGTQVYQP